MAETSENEVYQSLGYLANPLVSLRYDVQVPPKKQGEFEALYREWSGELPCAPSSGGGYSVLSPTSDKRSVQYRFSYSPQGSVPTYLEKLSKSGGAAKGTLRISNKELLIRMFQNGFVLGAAPSRSTIVAKINPQYLVSFEFGYSAASLEQGGLEYDAFATGFSHIEHSPEKEFQMFEPINRRTVYSEKLGRSAAFRHHVLQAYQNQCCVCSGSLVDLSGAYETEAAHIVPKRHFGTDDVRNGLGLCRKHHWAFDRGMFGIEDDYRITVSEKVLAISENASLKKYVGGLVELPKNDQAPNSAALKWHRENVFRF